MIIPSTLLLLSLTTHVLARTQLPSKGEITPCGEYELRGSDYIELVELDRPCTSDAISANWVARPFLMEKSILLCGEGSSSDFARLRACPDVSDGFTEVITGKYDVTPVDESFGGKYETGRSLCGSYTFKSGQHTEMVKLETV
jgi:hypothetical protein